jgi:hypothetical protein
VHFFPLKKTCVFVQFKKSIVRPTASQYSDHSHVSTSRKKRSLKKLCSKKILVNVDSQQLSFDLFKRLSVRRGIIANACSKLMDHKPLSLNGDFELIPADI